MPVNFKASTASRTTITRDTLDLEQETGNIYESVAIMAKRSNQINVELKEELLRKLEEFAPSTDNLEEIFENREQIEISKFYERLPKPHNISIYELLNEEIYFRLPEENTDITSIASAED
jgi:DNA-directed RNA polymerase subunit K/omega